MTKLTGILLCLLLLLFVFTQPSVQSRIILWPAKLDINIESFSDDPIVFKRVQVKNTENNTITVRSEIDHPSETNIKDGYSFIPDLSWVIVTPKEMEIPARSEGYFNITINIPKQNQSQLNNEHWEVSVRFYEVKKSSSDPVNFLVKLGSRIFINTPNVDAKEQQTSPNFFIILWFAGMGGLAIATIYFYVRNRTKYGQKSAVYYLKDKDRKHHKRK